MSNKIDKILAEISAGELFDKITILEIKQAKISNKEKLIDINKELSSLNETVKKFVPDQSNISKYINDLKNINLKLWDIEEGKRAAEKNKDFGEKFIELAEKRVNNLLLSIRLVKNLSNKNNYIYTDEDVVKITMTIDEAVKDLKNEFSDLEIINKSMENVHQYAISQYNSVRDYLKKIGVEKEVHIGELGWSTVSNELYGEQGTHAADEYKQALFFDKIREWTTKEKISCFYFEAFDEPWKDAQNINGSENHFGLFTVDGKAKYALWKNVDNGDFKGLTRNGNSIIKTFNGNSEILFNSILTPPVIE